jgi:hypothetical protein
MVKECKNNRLVVLTNEVNSERKWIGLRVGISGFERDLERATYLYTSGHFWTHRCTCMRPVLPSSDESLTKPARYRLEDFWSIWILESENEGPWVRKWGNGSLTTCPCVLVETRAKWDINAKPPKAGSRADLSCLSHVMICGCETVGTRRLIGQGLAIKKTWDEIPLYFGYFFVHHRIIPKLSIH